MKKVILAGLALFLFSSPAEAVQEGAALEAALAPNAVSEAAHAAGSDTFSLTVFSSGRLDVKPGPVFTEGGDYSGMVLPYLVSEPRPIRYPRWAVRQGWEGNLEIAIEILKDGSVDRFKVMKSTGHKMLDAAAVKAVRTWRFRPAMKDGQAVVTCVQIPVFFQLEKTAS